MSGYSQNHWQWALMYGNSTVAEYSTDKAQIKWKIKKLDCTTILLEAVFRNGMKILDIFVKK